MKARLCTVFLALTICLPGCVGERDVSNHEGAELIEVDSGKTLVVISSRRWVGFWGPEGYGGYRLYGYTAALAGDGPVFVNPHFVDNPPSFRCVGTITLDRERKRVVVNMQRIVSKEGETEKRKPHPANGVYSIQSVKKAGRDDSWF